jgi:hypothetical protein
MTPGRAAGQLADQNWATSQAARAAIASFTAAVRAAQIALVGLQEEALTGTRTVLDVLVDESSSGLRPKLSWSPPSATRRSPSSMSPSTGGYRWHHPKVS